MPRPPDPEATIDLDVPAEPEPVAERETAEDSPSPSPLARASTRPLEPERATPTPAPRAEERPGPPQPSESGSSGGGEPASPIQLTKPQVADIGLGGTNRFLPKSQAAVENAESRRAVDRAVRDPARERERELGLGPEGPVLTALAESTARSIAPVKGRAVFVATTNAGGEVATIELTESEGGRAGWADAAQLALAALKGKKLRLPSTVSRAVMRIEITSAWKLPSGQDPGTDITLFHIPIAKGEGKDSPKMTILDPVPKFHVDYIEIGGPGGVKIPIVSVQIDLFNTNADPSNIGARPRRIVHAHPLDTQLM
jgi:hypothetical protein